MVTLSWRRKLVTENTKLGSHEVHTALMDIGQLGAIKSLVSDRAKALIQLAVKGMGCQSIPDLFHAMRCLSRSIGVRLGGKLAHTKKKLQKTQEEITKRHLAKKPISSQLSQRQSWLQQEYQFIQTGLDPYQLSSTAKALEQFSSQINGIAVGIDLWCLNFSGQLQPLKDVMVIYLLFITVDVGCQRRIYKC